MSRPGRPWVVATYRTALRLLPAEARRRHAPQMAAMFADGCDDLAGIARWRFVVRAFLDVVVQAVAFRIEERLEGRPSAVEGVREAARDLGLAVRALRRKPGFSAVVVLTLTLGIGLNSAMFSFVNGLLLRPLPYERPDRLVQLSESARDFGTIDLSLPDFALWRSETTVFEGMFAFDDAAFLLESSLAAAGGQARPVEGAVVSPGFLDVLGVPLAVGRSFSAEDERPGGEATVIVGHDVWTERLGADPEVVGRTIRVNGVTRTIVGVAPRGFAFPEVAELWVPLAFEATRANPFDYGYDAIGRLRGDATLSDARAEGERIAGLLRASFPGEKAGIGTEVYPLRYADVPGGLAGAALAALAAVTLVLLVACTNVAALLVARGEERRTEMATRHALGASRARLLRLVLAECLLLTSVGCAGAVAVALGAEGVLERVLPAERPYWLDFRLDATVLGWTLAVGGVTCFAIAAAPAVQAARARRDSGPGVSTRTVVVGTRPALVVAQVGFAAALVVVAGLTLRALDGLQRTDPGVEPHDVLVLDVILPPWAYGDEASRSEAATRVLAAAASVPSVEEVAITGSVPFVGTGAEVTVDPGGDASASASRVAVLTTFEGPFFAVMGIPLEVGRPPSDAERMDGAPVAIVSRGLATRLWPGQDPIGRRLRHSEPDARSPAIGPEHPWLSVIGVAGDVRAEGPARPPRGEIYVPRRRHPSSVVSLVARTSDAPLAHVRAVESAVAEAERGVAFAEPTTLEIALGHSTWTERLASGLITGFAALALFLALLGVQGLVSNDARRRAREIAVRTALGASPARIRLGITAGTLRLVGPGVGVGLLAAVGVVTVASRSVTWMPPPDASTLALTAAVLITSAAVASYVPAGVMAAADPARSLRSE